MAEHEGAAEPANDPEFTPAPAIEPDATAMALALGKAGRDKSFAVEAAGFLRDQRRMLALQMEHLHEQRALQVEHLKQQEKHLRLRYFGDRLRIGLQLLGIFAGLAVVVFMSALAWNAHEDHGVAIEAFSAPPDLVQRGLTGQVIASQLLDRLASLQAQTVTSRPASTYANDWGGDIKVEIPETGVSIGELNRYLRQWLGSETKISGEVVHTPTGVAVTARAGASPGRRFEGPEADLDKLIGRAAEAVYADTQPYRYAVYLASQGRTAEATTAFSKLTRSGPSEDRAWAYLGLASIAFQQNQFAETARLAEAARLLNPRLQPVYPILGLALSASGRVEQMLAHIHRELRLLKSGRAIGLPGGAAATPGRIQLLEGIEAAQTGDFQRAVILVRSLPPFAFEGVVQGYRPQTLEADSLANLHEFTALRRLLATSPSLPRIDGLSARMNELTGLEDWRTLASAMDQARALQPSLVASNPSAFAVVYARVGQFREAETLVANTPLDCADCLRARGLIASLQKDWVSADRWYGAAARLTPSFPFVPTEWGAQLLLVKGDPDVAIAKLSAAHRISPHFADPVEFWGEALMRKRDLTGAIAKLSGAGRYAPRWGRNRMMWGEALMLSGRYAEARRQYETAKSLDLSKPDRAALDVLLARTARGALHG